MLYLIIRCGYNKDGRIAKEEIEVLSTKNGEKIEADILITNDCNLGCKHCLYRNNQKKPCNMSLDVFSQLEKFFSGSDIEYHLLGGEPLCNPIFIDILEYLKKKGRYVQILTNGRNLTDKILSECIALKIDSVGFSLEGNKTTHDVNRGDGSYDDVISSIARCTEKNLTPKISTCVHNKNYHAMEEMIITLSKFGIKRILFEYFVPIGEKAYEMEMLPPTEWLDFLNSIKKCNEKYGLRIIAQKVFMGESSCEKKAIVPCLCTDGKYPVIDSYGNYYPCILFYAVGCSMCNILDGKSHNWLDIQKQIADFCKKLYDSCFSANDENGTNIHCPALLYALKNGNMDASVIRNCNNEVGCFHIVESL